MMAGGGGKPAFPGMACDGSPPNAGTLIGGGGPTGALGTPGAPGATIG
jgi:hypothetical protein